ncbi:MAG: hypothetical protein P4L64_14830 [Caulobacteraceae bacterium]|nr:hypothetical protein [Caulobacteraceae bacterium]
MKWTEARQVVRLLGWPQGDGPDPSKPPSHYFEGLRRADRLADAAKFLGMALPRWETVAWAARVLREVGERNPGSPEADTLKAVMLWIQDPTEARRRATYDAAQGADVASPERLAAMAVFYSGGSVAPPDCEPLPAPRDAAGRFSAGAVLAAAARTQDPVMALNRGLDLGTTLAVEPEESGAK